MRRSLLSLIKGQPEQVSLVIIGAGAAGIAAGCRLLENGFKDFVILEADERIGGRVFTIKHDNGSLDLGAEWVHGEKGNAVYDLAEQYGLLYRSDSPFEASPLYRSDGYRYPDNISVELMAMLDDIIDNQQAEIKRYSGSLGDFITERYWQKVHPLIDEGKITRSDAEDCLHWLEHVENSIDGSPSWFKTAANEAIYYQKIPGNVLNTWKIGGFQTALDLLMKKYPNPGNTLNLESNVKLRKEVTNVDWSGTRVIVSCSDGSQISAERIITTVSLNVLKATYDKLFNPALPPNHQKAIKALGMGTVDKIFLDFPYRWWDAGTRGVGCVWRAEDIIKLPKSQQWTAGLLGFYEEDNHPTILCGWIVGAHAEAMEAVPAEEVKIECVNVLKRFVGGFAEIPQPRSIHRSRWFSKSNFKGSYSCRMVESNKMDAWPRHLAEPVQNSVGKQILLFAGEATHEKYFSTVHGAIESGWREAERFLSFLNIEKRYSVAIVGAGIAGLAAALTLTAAGIDVIVLEAQGYIGGRIKSISSECGNLEMGAQWLHGEQTELYQYANDHDLLSDENSQEGGGRFCRLNGSSVSNDLVYEVNDAVSKILQDCEKYAESNIYPSSIGDELDIRGSQHMRASVGSNEMQELFDWHRRFQQIDNSCDSLKRLSAKAWGAYKDCGEKHNINFKKSFSALIDTIVQKLPSDVIKVNTPVRRVEWGDAIGGNKNIKGRVRLICDNLNILADHVIVTSSLGFLKEHKDTFFYPSLPNNLIKAIELLGFGSITKMYLTYSEPWWSEEEKGFQLLWNDDDEEAQKLFAAVPWAVGLTGFDVLPGRPVLLGWVGGAAAALVESISEKKLKEQATEVLRLFIGLRSIPLPRSIYRSNWHSNEYVRGSYSHVTTDCDASNITNTALNEPVYTKNKNIFKKQCPTILLAGEACHPAHYSTVHGAYESGHAQANVILDYVKVAKVPAKL